VVSHTFIFQNTIFPELSLLAQMIKSQSREFIKKAMNLKRNFGISRIPYRQRFSETLEAIPYREIPLFIEDFFNSSC